MKILSRKPVSDKRSVLLADCCEAVGVLPYKLLHKAWWPIYQLRSLMAPYGHRLSALTDVSREARDRWQAMFPMPAPRLSRQVEALARKYDRSQKAELLFDLYQAFDVLRDCDLERILAILRPKAALFVSPEHRFYVKDDAPTYRQVQVVW